MLIGLFLIGSPLFAVGRFVLESFKIESDSLIIVVMMISTLTGVWLALRISRRGAGKGAARGSARSASTGRVEQWSRRVRLAFLLFGIWCVVEACFGVPVVWERNALMALFIIPVNWVMEHHFDLMGKTSHE